MASHGKNLLASGSGAANIDGPKQEPVTRVEIEDADCKEGEAFIHTFPAFTSFHDIETVVRLLYPTARYIGIFLEE